MEPLPNEYFLTEPITFSRNLRNIDDSDATKSKDGEELQVRKSLFHTLSEQLDKLGRTVFYQRIVIVAKNKENFPRPTTDADGRTITEEEEISFKTAFALELDKIMDFCNKNIFLNEKTTGFFLWMGDYTILLLEGAEEILQDFCEQLLLISADFWSADRVFLLQDNISESFFNHCATFRSTAMNINEKFPTNTINDRGLIAEQHTEIKTRLIEIFKNLGQSITKPKDSEKVKEETWKARRAVMRQREMEKKLYGSYHVVKFIKKFSKPCAFKIEKSDESSTDSSEEEVLEEVEHLPVEYYKLLPEAQRIDIVLNCPRFYRSLADHVKLTSIVLVQTDEESMIWPNPYNYLPMGIFDRSPYDVNLTFPNYKIGEEQEKKEEQYDEEEYEEDYDQYKESIV